MLRQLIPVLALFALLPRTAAPRAQSTAGEGLARGALESIARVHTDPGDLPRLKVQADGKTVELPLEHTHVRATLTGSVGEVEVTQTYKNPFSHPIEAVYVFPLPENSAVYAMRMVIGARVVEAEVQKRADARATYEQAKRDGHTAALLEQERPNVFTQSVANIEPGTKIDVVVRYLQTLTYDAGEYEFVFPMVVGPRFMPGAPLARPPSGSGTKADTTDVPDASRISPPVLGQGWRSGHDISLELTADAGLPVSSFEVPTHEVEAAADDGKLVLRLAASDSIPNRDFVLRYRVDGATPELALLAHKGDQGGFLTLIVQPPHLDVDALVGQRELVFVVDVSGSMSGVPLSMCQDAMEHALGQIRPVDTFNVITFAGSTARLFETPAPANDVNIKRALELVRGLRAGGGTYMLDGIAAALSDEIEKGRRRYVFFMTDGYVGNEAQILDATSRFVAALETKGQQAKVFGFGVGSSTNRYLLDGLAKAGKGVTVYSTTREDPTLAVNSYFRVIDRPVLEDVQIDWGGLDVDQLYPTRLPDLFATRPLIVHARYGEAGSGTVRVRGKANGKKVELTLAATLPARESDNRVLAPLWARAKIDWLERDLWAGDAMQAERAITDLGLEFHLVTAYTSLVAVDRTRTVNGKLETIVQPVETPEGVDAAMAGAGIIGGRAHTTAALGMMPMRMAAPAPGMPHQGKKEVERLQAPALRSVSEAAPSALDAADAPTVAPAPVHAPAKPRVVELRTNGIAKDAVVRILESKLSTLACLSALRGRVQLSWFVTATGKAIQVRVLTEGRDAALAACLERALATWAFPAPTSHAPATVTLTLER